MERRGTARDIIVTVPKSVRWEDYEKELAEVEKGGTINFKVGNFPNTDVGCKCYLCHDGFVKGDMMICGMSEKDFTCTTTGKKWKGKFIERSGTFYPLENPYAMKGFQGFRYV